MDNKKDPGPTCQAVRSLRESFGDTQQHFAGRLNMAISTVVRYELTRPPKGEVLVRFMNLADANGRTDLAEIFRQTISRELGYEVPIPARGESGLPYTPSEMQEHESLSLILRLAQSGVPKYVKLRDRWYNLRQSIVDDQTKGDLIRSAGAGFLLDLYRRLDAGQSEDEIVSAFPSYPADTIRTVIKGKRDGVNVQFNTPAAWRGDAK